MRTTQEFSQLFKLFVTDVLALLGKGRPTEAKKATSTDTVDGHSLEDFRKEYKEIISRHVNAHNPHELSAWYLGSPTKKDVDEAFKKFLPTNVYPLSYFLKTHEPHDYYYAKTLDDGSMEVNIHEWPCVLSGTTYIIPKLDITLKDEAKCYVVLTRGRPSYKVIPKDQSLSESNTRMYLGRITKYGVPEGEPKEITRVDLYRYSDKPLGSAIPIVNGWDNDKDTPNMDEAWYPDPGHIFIDSSNADEYTSFILPKGTYSVLLMSGGADSQIIKFQDGLIRETYPYYTVGAAGALLKGRITLSRPTRVGIRLTSRLGKPDVLDWTTLKLDNINQTTNGTYMTVRADNGTSYTATLDTASGRASAAAVNMQRLVRPYVENGNIMVPVDTAHTQHMTIVTRNSSTDGMKFGDSSLMINKWGNYVDMMNSIDPTIDHGFSGGKPMWCASDTQTVSWAAVYGTDGKVYNDFQVPAPGGFGDGMRRSIYLGDFATLYGSGLTRTQGYGYGAGAIHGAKGTSGFASIIKIS